MKKASLLSKILAAVCALALLASCAVPADDSSGTPQGGENTGSAGQISAMPSGALYTYAESDLDGSYDAASATAINLSGVTAEIDGDGAAAGDGLVTINATGTYILSGDFTGQIFIDATDEAVVRLVLDGVNLTATDSTAIYADDVGKVVIILADGGVNTVTDTENYLFEAGTDEPDAAIFVKNDLSITGGGSLVVNANYRNGIQAKDYLVITGGDITVTAANDALRGRDGVAILDGTFNLTAGNDGIKSNNDSEDGRGFVCIDGGDFTIDAACDGIQAETELSVAGGSFDIVTGGGSASAPAHTEDFHAMFGGTQPAETATDESTDSTDSFKALKAGTALNLYGGDFTIDAEDDAFHANGDLTVGGGSYSIKTGDDAFHADNAMTVNDGVIRIESCYEGIEGATVDINGGDITIHASDDGINAAGGSDSTDGFGPMGDDRFSAASSSYYIRITGGDLEIVAGCDALDSNGNIYIEGGTTYLNGPNMGMDGAIDLDGSFSITGGTVLAVGSTYAPSGDITQPVLMVSLSQAIPAGGIVIYDESGAAILEYTSQIDVAALFITAPNLDVGASYTIEVNGERSSTVTLSDTLTQTGFDGGSYAGASTPGGFGGGFGDGGGDRGQAGAPGDFAPPDGFAPSDNDNNRTPPSMPNG